MCTKMTLRLTSNRLSKSNGESPYRDADSGSRSRNKKRKLSDVLDSHWSREELERFYDAFRKYGKKWKKVATVVRTKSTDMAEALYNKNRAYLSLPEGAANVEGLIANIADRYGTLAESDSDHEVDDALKKSRKPLKCTRGEVQLDILKRPDGPHLEHFHNPSSRSRNKRQAPRLSSYLLRWPTKRRTPRFHVTEYQDAGFDINPHIKSSLKADGEASHGKDSYGAVVELLGTTQGSVPPSISQDLGRTELIRSSFVQCDKEKGNHQFPDSLRTDANGGVISEDVRQLDPDVSNEIQQKRMRFVIKGAGPLGSKSSNSDDAQKLSTYEDIELNGQHTKVSKENTEAPSHNQEKRSHEHLLEDESSFLDPMDMLASLAVQEFSFDTVSADLVGQQNRTDSSSPSSDCPGTSFVNSKRSKHKMSVQEETRHSSSAAKQSSSPCSSACHENDNLSYSYQSHRRQPPNVSSKLHGHGTLSAIPESTKSTMLARKDRFSTAETSYTSLKASRGDKDTCSDGKNISELKEEIGPMISKMQHTEKNKLIEKDGELRRRDSAVNLYSKSDRNQDDCLTERRVRNSTKLPNPLEAVHEQDGAVIPNGSASAVPTGSLAKSQGFSLSKQTKVKEAENGETVLAQLPGSTEDCTQSDIQSKEADIKAMADLSTALDKKEAVVNVLKQVNENVLSGRRNDSELITEYNEQYQMVLGLLNDVRDPAASAFFNLRKRNTYNRNSTSPYLSSIGNSNGLGGRPGSPTADYLTCQDCPSHVPEIVANSRKRAKKMVDTSLMAISTKNAGGDNYTRIGVALDSVELQQVGTEYNMLGTECSRPSSELEKPEARSCIPRQFNAVPMPFPGVSSAKEPSSSDLITACVSTILMIGDASGIRYPPADVAGVLEHAVQSVKPCSSQNLNIYGDIEKYMGIIKTQALTLVPTPCATFPTKITYYG